MSKELIISAIVVIFLIIANILIGNFIDGKMNQTVSILEEVKKGIQNDDFAMAKQKLDEAENFWNESEEIISFFVEHNELEKVNTEFAALRAYVQLEEDEALENLNKVSFIIEHIEEKDDLRLKNIF